MSFRFRIFPFILFFTGVLTGVSFYFMIEEKCPKSIKESSRSSSLRRYSTSVPMLFIGGHPRSGTTLMRVLLDAHPLYHCGQETHIIPDLLTLQRKYSRGRNFERIREAGLDLEAINRLIAETILNIIQSRGALNSRQRLCNKDPFVLKHISYLARMFPKAQFILMVRDPRAVIHSIRENKIKISRFPKKNSDAFRRWNKILEIMFKDCLLIGKQRCKILHYERLVLKPRFTLQEILRFLQSPWSENVMNHTEHLNRAGGILLSR